MSYRGGKQCEDCVEERPKTVIACQRRKGREEEDRNKKPITATTSVGVNDVRRVHTAWCKKILAYLNFSPSSRPPN